MKILIVDDNDDNRYFLEVFFQSRDHQTVSAANGADALELLRREPVDLILSDIMMPKMDGYRFCRECKEDAKLRDIPFCFITSTYLEEKDREFALGLGAEEFIMRPIDDAELMKIVERAIETREKGGRGIVSESDFLSAYAERVVRKLEKKVSELEKEMAARKIAESALQEREERLRLIAETIDDVFWISTPGAKKMLYISPAYERIWERSRESLYSDPKSFLEAVHPQDISELERTARLHEEGQPYEAEYRIVKKSGEVRWMRERGFPVINGNGKLRAMTGVVSDISERKLLEIELERQARTDSLTGAANRRHFYSEAQETIALSRRYGRPLSLLMLDIDYFKAVNDSYGHGAGDLILQEMVRTCLQVLRDVDFFGRIGGEEFAVLLPETGKERALQVAERLRQTLAELAVPFRGEKLRITVSIGVATLLDTDTGIDSLMIRADRTLYRAKESGRNKVCCEEPS